MRSYLIISIGLALAALTAFSLAQDAQPQPLRKQLVTRASVKEFNDVFLGSLISARVYDAFQIMKTAAPDAEADIEATRQSTEQLLDSVRQTYGKPVDFELVDTTTLGESFLRYDYLLKLEKSALHYRATYYKATRNANWIPVQITFDENLADLFETIGKSENRVVNK